MFINFALTVFTLALLVLLLRKSFYLVSVFGTSMQPTYHHGDKVLVVCLWPILKLNRGIVVLTEIPDSDSLALKRVLALPHESISTHITEIHEKMRETQLINHNANGQRLWPIPARHYFLTGDSIGTDSRVWGPIPRKMIKGIVIYKLNH